MCVKRTLIWAIVLCAAVLQCNDSSLSPDIPNIRAVEISVDELPSSFDVDRTFHIRLGTVEEPEEFLVMLWNTGLRPSRAWQPLDDRCNDPLGARFTIELDSRDERIHDFGFEDGVGRLFCASRLVLFTVTDGS